jgi:hypothetical protein
MNDEQLIKVICARFRAASDEVLADRIMNIQIDDLGFTDHKGKPFTKIERLPVEKKEAKAFGVFRLGYANGRVWELVIIDGIDPPHIHVKTKSEFVIVKGGGYLSHDDKWDEYREDSRTKIGNGVAHGFVTDPRQGATVFLSVQTDPIKDPETGKDDFVRVEDKFPVPPNLVAWRQDLLAKLGT